MLPQILHICLRRIGPAAALAAMLLTASCIKEGDGGKGASGNVKLQLKLPVGITGASGLVTDDYIDLAHEDRIDHLHVLLFDNVTEEFIDVLLAEEYGMSSAENPIYLVQVTPGTYHMVLLANCGEMIENSGIADGGFDYLEDVRRVLTAEMWDKWVIDEDDPGFRPMMMWGEKKSVTVTDTGADLTGTNLVPMLRMMARIDVKLSTEGIPSAADLWDLHSVHLYNWHHTGQAIPNDEANIAFSQTGGVWNFSIDQPSIPTIGTKNSEPLVYKMVPPVTEYVASVYTFETDGPDRTDPDAVYDPMEYPCLVLGISEKGQGISVRSDQNYNGTGIYYYRVDFIDNDGNWLDILRNHKYTFTVNDITHQGFPDPDKAHRSWIYDLDYTLDWEIGFDGGITNGGDGIYRLDISQTYFDIPTGSFNFRISSTHPEGWSAYPSKYPDKIEPAEYLLMVNAIDDRLYETGDTSYRYLPDADGNLMNIPAGGNFEISAKSINPGWTGEYPAGQANIIEEYIHIVSGNLTNVVTVRVTGRALQ